jgi:HAD superfamily hydrolase (TIGR01509 family)
MSVSGLLCDLDGTLLDTEPLYELAMNSALDTLGKSFPWHVQQQILGKPEIEGAGIIVKQLGLDMEPTQLLQLRDNVLLELFRNVKPKRGAMELLQQAHARNIPIAIATSSNRKYLHLKASNNKTLFDLVQHVICGDDPAVVGKGKPNPDIYLEAAKAIGKSPNQCIVLEDAHAGFLAAKAANAKIVCVCPDHRMSKELFAGADFIVREWDEIDLDTLLNASNS